MLSVVAPAALAVVIALSWQRQICVVGIHKVGYDSQASGSACSAVPSTSCCAASVAVAAFCLFCGGGAFFCSSDAAAFDAPQEVTRKTLRRAQTGREQRAVEQVDTRVLGSQGAAHGRDARGGWVQGCMARGQHACGTLQSFVCCAGRQKGSGHCSGAREILMGGELSPATRRRPRGAHRGSAICIGQNETSPAVPAVGIKILARSWAWTG